MASGIVEQTNSAELLGHGHHVHVFASTSELLNGRRNVLVSALVEVVGVEGVEILHGRLGEKRRTEGGLLGVEVVRLSLIHI